MDDQETSLDPIFAMKIRFACGSVGLVGLVYLTALLIYLAPGLSLIGSNNSVTDSTDVRHSRWFGTQYEIRVRGETFWCSGGDRKTGGGRGIPVTYDALAPDHCRAEATVGTLGVYELIAALTSSTFVAAGLAATVVWKYRRARRVAFACAILLGWADILLAFILHRGSHG